MHAVEHNAIEADVVPDLTESDLEKLGLPLGHRKRLMKAIASLGGASPSPAPTPAPSEAGSAERRQVTVMFCDLVGSTAMSARLDPEDMRTIIGAYHRCCAALVERGDPDRWRSAMTAPAGPARWGGSARRCGGRR